MYTTLIKYGVTAIAAIGIVLGIYFYGHHEGSLAGSLQVAKLEQTIASNTATFQQQVRTIEEQNTTRVNQERDTYNATVQNQTKSIAKLNTTISGLRQQSSGYVAQIERLSGQDCTASNSALELANRQYADLADAARQASQRADSSAAIANTLNQFEVNVK